MKAQKRGILPLSPQETRFLRQIGRKIGEYAARRKVSIERLAYEAGVSKGYLYDIVKGKGNPSIVILERVAEALNISSWMLLK